MTTLITNGASATGIALGKLLVASGHPVVFGSRSGAGIPEGFDIVKLDWEDQSTFINPFKITNADGTIRTIQSVYILSSRPDPNPLQFIGPFIDLAIEHGVKRFILLAGSSADPEVSTGHPYEKVYKYLIDKGIDYFVVRPTWFTENFDRVLGHGIRGKDEFETPVPTGKIPFVAVQDIAQAAYEAIVNEKNTVRDKIVIGPEYLTYDEAAGILSDVLGRKITHKVVPTAHIVEQLKAFGVPGEFASVLERLYVNTEKGSEVEWAQRLPKERIHKGTVTIREWAEKNKGLLQPIKA